MKKVVPKLLVVLMVFGYALLQPISILAQESEGDLEKKYFGLIINPTITELNLNPGESAVGEFMLTNDYQSKQTVVLQNRLNDVVQQGGEARLVDPSDTELVEKYEPLSMKSWITVSQEEISLEYGETLNVDFNIVVPDDATPGGHYAAITFNRESEALEEEAFSGTGLDQGLGHLIFINVKGDVDENGSFIEFKTDKSWYDFAPVNFIIEMENTGNTHTNIGGNIFVYKDELTEPIHTFKVNEAGYFVLPLNSRNFSHRWNTGFIQWEEDSNGKKALKIDKEEAPKIHFGKYNAQLKLKHSVDGDRVTTEDNLSFWVIPWEIILVCLLVLGVIIYFIKKRLTRKKKVKKKVLRKKVPVNSEVISE